MGPELISKPWHDNNRAEKMIHPSRARPTTAVASIVERLRAQGALTDGVAGIDEKAVLPAVYPKVFSRLWDEHLFSAFAVGDVRVAGNIRGEDESLEALLSDPVLTDRLIAAGFLPFGRPSDGGYDRICFDARKKARRGDAPVVRMAHESILSFDRLPRPVLLAEGFIALCAVGHEQG
jgi:hypothetical protein